VPVFLQYLQRLLLTNPIAVRLVHNGGRRSKHMYIRSAYLAALIIVLLWTLLLNTSSRLSYQDLAAAGAASFTAIAYLQITLICVLAPVFMGGAIAQEANPKNWEVILTTPLTAGQIVLGNLFGRLFFVIALLACSLPLFAITQYFGGVPGSSILASYLVAAGAALLVGTTAIALSVSRLVGKRAFFVFYVAVVSYLAVTFAIDLLLRRTTGGVTLMTSLNPFLSLQALLNPTTYPRAAPGTHAGLTGWMLEKPVTTWCVGSVVVSMLLMAASTITVRAGGLQTLGEGDDGVSVWRKLGRKKTAGVDAQAGGSRAPRSVWQNPIAWREAASRNSSPGKVLARWAFLVAGGAFGLVLIALYHFGTLSHAEFRLALAATISAELLVVALIAINTAATAISKEREDGHLDLLLTTPITAGAYLWGKLRGLVAYIVPLASVPLGTLMFASLYVLANGLGRQGGVLLGSGEPVVLPEAGWLAPVAVIPFMAFCVMVGLYWSLGSKGVLGSVVGTVAVVGVVTGIIGLCAWNVSSSTGVGPVFAGLSPASFLKLSIDTGTIGPWQSSPIGERIALAVGTLIGALVNFGICYSIHSALVRTFDVTVRRLAGGK
jgi:ABC-type transport system involved in multi-copper enzyme maturation permease subunit